MFIDYQQQQQHLEEDEEEEPVSGSSRSRSLLAAGDLLVQCWWRCLFAGSMLSLILR
jgi:hypothetical protein